MATLPPFGPIVFSKFSANEGLRRTGLHLSLSEKIQFYLHLRSPIHVVPPQLESLTTHNPLGNLLR
jgi:hypothetical protein